MADNIDVLDATSATKTLRAVDDAGVYTPQNQAVGNVAAGAADSGNPVKVGGKFNSSVPTLANGDRGDLQVTVYGALRSFASGPLGVAADGDTNSTVGIGRSDAGEAAGGFALRTYPFVYNGATWDRQRGDTTGLAIQGDSYNHITTATTTTVKASAGVIKAVVVNSLGTVASTVTVKDNATVIGIIDSLSTTGRTGSFVFNVKCATNITVVTTGTVAPDVTVTYQ